jgi:hypothetical protein
MTHTGQLGQVMKEGFSDRVPNADVMPVCSDADLWACWDRGLLISTPVSAHLCLVPKETQASCNWQVCYLRLHRVSGGIQELLGPKGTLPVAVEKGWLQIHTTLHTKALSGRWPGKHSLGLTVFIWETISLLPGVVEHNCWWPPKHWCLLHIYSGLLGTVQAYWPSSFLMFMDQGKTCPFVTTWGKGKWYFNFNPNSILGKNTLEKMSLFYPW